MRRVRTLIVASVVFTTVATRCWRDEQDETSSTRIVREIASPDGRLVARYAVLSGGGAVGYVQEVVELRARGDSAATDATTTIFKMSHGGDVTIAWHDARHLEIVYPAWAEVLRGCHIAHGIDIRFTPRATPDSLWADAAQTEWRNERAMEADCARRGEPSLRDSSPGLVGKCS